MDANMHFVCVLRGVKALQSVGGPGRESPRRVRGGWAA